MKKLFAFFLKWLFLFHFFKKRYYGIIRRINKSQLFRNFEILGHYDQNIKVKLFLDDWVQQQIWFLGYYEYEQTLFFIRHLKKTDVFYDIGANIGYYTLLAAKRLTEGKVYAFEPDDKNRKQLLENIEMNGFKNVVVIDKIVSNRSEKNIKFYTSDNNNRGMSSVFAQDNFSGKIEIKESITIDFFTSLNTFPTIVKIDTEGSESQIIEGMISVLDQQITTLYMELNSETLGFKNLTITDLINKMRQLNYFPFQINEASQLSEIDCELDCSLAVFLPKNHIESLFK
jgi:FkbM family methyltransferase